MVRLVPESIIPGLYLNSWKENDGKGVNEMNRSVESLLIVAALILLVVLLTAVPFR